jgi:hypothetical protein
MDLFTGEYGKPFPLGIRLQCVAFAVCVPILFVLGVVLLAILGIASALVALWIAFFDWAPIGIGKPSKIKAVLRKFGYKA